MKKFSYVVASLMLGTTVTASPAPARTHSIHNESGTAAAVQQVQNEEEGKAYKELYEPCFKQKDDDKCYPLAKSFAEKYPNSQFFKYVNAKVTAYEAKKLYDNFQNSLKDFYGGPDEAKLNKVLSTGGDLTAKYPDNQFAVTQMALATGGGVLGGYYKDTAKAQELAEKALKMLEPTAAPKDWKQADWDQFRTQGISSLTLYEGLYQLRQPTPNVEKSVEYFNKVTANKDWPSAKEPATYLLRAEANNITYEKLSEEYRAMSDEDKRGDRGKAVLAKIDPAVDALIDDYARAYAIASQNPAMKAIAEDIKPRLENFWKYRNGGKLDGMTEYVKRYESDPTAPAPAPKAASAAPATPAAKP